MTVCLRAHHLLCLLTYAGTGYTRAFTANFDAIVARVAAGEEVLIVAGPDDICAPLLDEPEAHCLRDSVCERDSLAARALADVLEVSIFEGQRITLEQRGLKSMREAFASGRTREACIGCEWHALCTGLAQREFRQARLGPAA